MPRTLPTLIALCLLFGASTCERDLHLDIEQDPVLVVYGNFTEGKTVQVRVSKSQDILDGQAQEFIPNAVVRLYEGTQMLETFSRFVSASDTTNIFYGSLFAKPAVGPRYTLEVEVPGYETASGSSHIPQPVRIQALERSGLSIRETAQGREFRYRVAVRFEHPADGQHYYHLHLYQRVSHFIDNGSETPWVTQTEMRPVEFSPALSTNDLQAYSGGGVLIAGDPLHGEYAFDVVAKINPGTERLGKLYAELRTVSEEYYLFHKSLTRQLRAPQGGFAEPVRVFSNMAGGLGVFAGYASHSDSLMIVQ